MIQLSAQTIKEIGCAQEDCPELPVVVLLLDNRDVVAGACKPTHLKVLMHATKILGTRRSIERLLPADVQV